MKKLGPRTKLPCAVATGGKVPRVLFPATLGILLLMSAPDNTLASDGCFRCHSELGGEAGKVARDFELSVHRQVGLGCQSCHGGDDVATTSARAKARGARYSGIPRFDAIPDLCGRCHASAEYMRRFKPAAHIDQVAQYRTSRHGRAARQGDTRVATCTSCHSAHKTRRSSDPESPTNRHRIAETCATCHSDPAQMKPYGLRTGLVEGYRNSLHGRLVAVGESAAPTCGDCHGQHGAAPPEASSLAHVCGGCHVNQSELFRRGPHAQVFATLGFDACVTCHEPHSRESRHNNFADGVPDSCRSCHTDGEPAQLCSQWASRFGDLDQRIRFVEGFFSDAEKAGVDVGAPLEMLSAARSRLSAARTVTHSLAQQEIATILDEGFKHTSEAYAEVIRGIEDLQQRSRMGYLILAFLVSTAALGAVLTTRSIKVRRREADALREERRKVQESRERLARVGEISAGVAHTIRNPLHGLLNCVDILKTKTEGENGSYELLGLMTEGLQRIHGVTQRLLVLTRETPLRKRPTDVSTLVQDALRFVEVRCHKSGLRIEFDLQDMPPIHIDPDQVSEALLNVLNNAIDASPDGGVLRISSFLSYSKRPEACLEIADPGKGIPAKEIQKVFDPFYTSKPIGEGTGLGLAITRRIVEEHEGSVEIESVVGSGTVVRLRLPTTEI